MSGPTRKIVPFIEYTSEATAACLVTMVQGNILAITLGHIGIAAQTGVVAGGIAAISLLAANARNRTIIALTLGVITAVVDFYIHPGMFGSVATEAIVTGAAAGIISYVLGGFIGKYATASDCPATKDSSA